MALPALAINPATLRAATSALAPLAKNLTASLSKLGPMMRSYNPSKMGQTFANNPKLAATMNNVRPKMTKMMESLKKSDSFQRLCEAAKEQLGEMALSGISNHRNEEKTAFRKQLFPPGVHSLSRESFSGNTSSISAMVGEERWHALLLAGENRRVTQTDWTPNNHGHTTCKTWEPGQQKTWDWTQNKGGDMIAMDQGKKLKDGSSERMAFFYPAGGGPIMHKLAHTDAHGKTTFRDPEVGAGKHHHGASDIKQQTVQTGFVEEIDDENEVKNNHKPVLQIEPAPTSQALVRRPPGASSSA